MPYGYDDNGNLTSDGSTAFVYDVENRLVQASGAKNASLRYDPLGRLYEVSGGGLGTRLFLYDGDALVAEYTGSGALAHRYVHGSAEGVDDPLVWYDGGVARWLHADHQGSIVAVTDGAGGSPTINAYDEYGVPKATNQGRFQYTGQAWIPELGMYHYKARVYDPRLGRFLQTDPVGYDDQINLYAYVGNDPLNLVDPEGLCGTGSRVSGNDYSGCRVEEGYADKARNNPGPAKPRLASAQPAGHWGAPQNASLSDDASEVFSQVRENWSLGKRGENIARRILTNHGYRIIGEQVYIRSSAGLRIIDFLTRKEGITYGWEAKIGFFAKRLSSQIAKDNVIATRGGVVRSLGALGGGLTYGSPVRYETGVISILDLEET